MRHTFTLDSIHKTYISQISLFTLRKNAQPQVKKALSGVSITLTPGLYGLLGPNGAGKSTLIHIITGTLAPDSGEVLWCGKPATGIAFRRILGYMPQQQTLYPGFTVERFLYYVASLRGMKRGDAAARIDWALGLLSLDAQRRKRIRSLSGGMRQRLLLAQAILADPEVLVLDEPTAGLDPQQRIAVRNLIAEIALHRIVLLSTHVVQDVEYAAKELILLSDGAVLRQASAQTLLREMQGQVWEVPARGEAEIAHLRTLGQFCGIVPSGEGLFVRLLAPAQPTPDSRPARPELEDVYLACFGEEGRL